MFVTYASNYKFPWLILLVYCFFVNAFRHRYLSSSNIDWYRCNTCHNLKSLHSLSSPVKLETLLLSTFSSVTEVWDNAVHSDSLRLADEIAKISGLGHTVYDRIQTKPRTCIENIIESILLNLNDHARYAEYWWRDEWINLDAHADIDEQLLLI